jgi:hypothetical protein
VTYPTPAQLDAWGDLLGPNWKPQIARVANAIERERRGGSAIPDGLTASGAGVGGHSGFIVDGEFVPATSVELVAIARQHAKDEHHDATVNAVGYLQQAMLSLCALVNILDLIEGRAHHDLGREPGCSNHARYKMWAERWRRDLCRDCYAFKGKFGVLPPRKLLDDHERGIRWTNMTIARALAEERAK